MKDKEIILWTVIVMFEKNSKDLNNVDILHHITKHVEIFFFLEHRET